MALATANPKVAAQHRELLTEIACCSEQAQRAEEWAELAWSAHSTMLAAKRQCSSASTTELFDLVSKNKAVAAWSTFDSQAAGAAVAKANRAVAALRASLPEHESLRLARVPIPSDVFDLVLDVAIAPSLDVFSFFNMSALSNAAARCGRAAGQLAEFAQRASDLATRAHAALQRAITAKETLEAPFFRAACDELPGRLRALL